MSLPNRKQNRKSEGKAARTTPSSMDATTHAPSTDDRQQADPGLAIIIQAHKIVFGLANLRCQLTALAAELPPEVRPSIAEYLPSVAEGLDHTQRELQEFALNVVDDLAGSSAIEDLRLKQLRRSTPERINQMRDTLGAMLQNARTLDVPQGLADDRDEVDLMLFEVNRRLNDLQKQLGGEGGDA